MLSVDEALERVRACATTKKASSHSIDEALGLILAEDVASDVDSPPHDKSVVDGYAVVAGDLARGACELEVLEEITAGAVPTQAVVSGKTSRIMTGAPLPAGADAVVMIEHTQIAQSSGAQRVQVAATRAGVGQNIVRRAASMARGQLVLRAGTTLRAAEVGLLAEVGRVSVMAIGRPRVAVLSTGNELVPPAETPARGQIRNSNGPLLVAAVRASGGIPIDLGIGRDDKDHLRERIGEGLKADVLVISGGVSAGVLDLVPSVLEDLGARQIFHKVSLKPGKPLWFGVAAKPDGQTLVFGLPGNPVSSFVCFEIFVRRAIAALLGRPNTGLDEVMAELAHAQTHRGERPTFQPARLAAHDGRWRVEPLRWQGSGDLRVLSDANALACFPAGDREYRADEVIRVLRLAQ
jgi:molybdopterin molybdotransferase